MGMSEISDDIDDVLKGQKKKIDILDLDSIDEFPDEDFELSED